MRESPKPLAEEPQYVGQPWVDSCIEPPRDTVIAALAERQYGVVSLRQLRSAGLGKAAVAKRGAAGRLHRIHRGVYAVGHARLTAHGRWLAAALAYGPNAVLSHRSAAALWGILESARATPDITVSSPCVRTRSGIDAHTTTTLIAADRAAEDGIPCTSVARTLVDLGDVVPRRQVERAVDQAEVLRLFDLRAIEATLARTGPRKGAGLLRAVLAELEGPTLTQSEFEERFLALCRSASLPQPEVNQRFTLDDGTAIKADFLWREQHLVVETDGFGFHSSRQSFEDDRFRDQRLRLAGFEVVRFTWRQVIRHPERVALTIAALLARALPAR